MASESRANLVLPQPTHTRFRSRSPTIRIRRFPSSISHRQTVSFPVSQVTDNFQNTNTAELSSPRRRSSSAPQNVPTDSEFSQMPAHLSRQRTAPEHLWTVDEDAANSNYPDLERRARTHNLAERVRRSNTISWPGRRWRDSARIIPQGYELQPECRPELVDFLDVVGKTVCFL